MGSPESRLFFAAEERADPQDPFFNALEVKTRGKWEKVVKRLAELKRSLYREAIEGNRGFEIAELRAKLVLNRSRIKQLYAELPFLQERDKILDRFQNLFNLEQEHEEAQAECQRLGELGDAHKSALRLFKESYQECLKQKDSFLLTGSCEIAKQQILQQGAALQSIKDPIVQNEVKKLHVLTLECFISSFEQLGEEHEKKQLTQFLKESWVEEGEPPVSQLDSDELREFKARAKEVKLRDELLFEKGSWWQSWFSFVPWSNSPKNETVVALEEIAQQLQLLESDINEKSQTILKFLKEEIRLARKKQIKEPKNRDERPILYYTLHLEMIADEIGMKIEKASPEKSQMAEEEFTKLQIYLIHKPVDTAPTFNLLSELNLLFQAAQTFASLPPKKIEERRCAVLLNILDVAGKETLQRADRATKKVFKGVMGSRIKNDSRDLQVFLAKSFVKGLFGHDDSSVAMLAVALPRLGMVLKMEAMKKMHQAFVAVRPAIPHLDEMSGLIQKLAVCRAELLPLNIVRYAEVMFRLQALRREENNFSPLFELAESYIKKLNYFPALLPLEVFEKGEATHKKQPSIQFTALAHALWTPEEQLPRTIKLFVKNLQFSRREPLWALHAFFLFKRALKGEALSDEEEIVLQELLTLYLTAEGERDLHEMVKVIPCEELLYDRILAEEKLLLKPLTRKYQETPRRGGLETFKKAVALYKEMRNLRRESHNPFTELELAEKKKELSNLLSEDYLLLKQWEKELQNPL